VLAAGFHVVAAQQAPKDDVLAERIARIEKGLLPSSIIKGKPLPFATVAERMGHFHDPGLTVAFIDNGKISWVRNYGFADVEGHRPVTEDTLFQCASISKPVTAVATMRLVQEGKIRLDEDINTMLQGWKIPENDFTREKKVTVRRVLSHTAGLTVHGFAGYELGDSLPTLEQMLNGEKPANSDPVRVEAVPGTVANYSGGGYVVLRKLLSDVMHQPFPEVMDRLVLKPVGMMHSTYQQPLPESLKLSAATAYQSNGQPFKGRFHIYPEMGPDGLWTTASDLARFALEIQNEYAGKSNKVLSQATAQEMLTPQKDERALGFVVSKAGGKPYFEHSGSNFGFFSEMFAFNESGGQGIIVLTNGNNIRLIYEYIRAVSREYSWPEFQPKERTLGNPVDSATLAKYAGTYENPEVGKIQISTRNNQLFIQASGMRMEEPEELFPESEASFFILTDSQPFTFKKDESGRVVELIIQYHSPLVAKKIS
jgi:CubicO group peptidase (beta-lactamase class C family)